MRRCLFWRKPLQREGTHSWERAHEPANYTARGRIGRRGGRTFRVRPRTGGPEAVSLDREGGDLRRGSSRETTVDSDRTQVGGARQARRAETEPRGVRSVDSDQYPVSYTHLTLPT